MDLANIKFIEPWDCDDVEFDSLRNELENELNENHQLFNKKIEIIARRFDKDDIAVFVEESKEIAFIHLTWSGRKEKGVWPITTICKNIVEVNQKLEHDNKEYNE